jgi:4-coumarate--CoA ligase
MFLTRNPIVSEYDISSVKDILCAAAPLSAELQAEFMDKFGISRVRQAYGMSELSPGVTIGPTTEPKSGSCGILVPNTELKLVNEERMELGLGETGEIAVRGPQVMKGYLNNIKATKEMIDEDGWLYTGDIGKMDDEGHLYVVDRLKELIKYKGHQVAPAELEGILLTHPDVADAAVIGIPHETGGEVPRGYVQLKPSTNPSEDDIIQFVNKEVNPFSWLRGGVEFVDAVPKSGTGKILRRELRKKHAAKV